MAEEGKAQSLQMKQKVTTPKTSAGSPPASKASLSSLGSEMDGSLNIAKAMVMTILNPLSVGKLMLTVLPEEGRSDTMKATANLFSGLGKMLSPSGSAGGGFLKTFQGAVDGKGLPGMSRLTQGAETLADKGGSLALKGGKTAVQKGAAMSTTLVGAIVGIPLMIGGGALVVGGAVAKGTAKVSKGTQKFIAVSRRVVRVTSRSVKAFSRSIKRRTGKARLLGALRVGRARATFRAIRGKVTQARRTVRRFVRRPLAPVRVRLRLAKRKVKAVHRKITAKARRIQRVVRTVSAPVKMVAHGLKALHHRGEALKHDLMGNEGAAASHKAKAKASTGKLRKTGAGFRQDLNALLGRNPKPFRARMTGLIRGPVKVLARAAKRLQGTKAAQATAKASGRVKALLRPVVQAAAKGHRAVRKVANSRAGNFIRGAAANSGRGLATGITSGARKAKATLKSHFSDFKGSAKTASGAAPYRLGPDEIVAVDTFLSLRIP